MFFRMAMLCWLSATLTTTFASTSTSVNIHSNTHVQLVKEVSDGSEYPYPPSSSRYNQKDVRPYLRKLQHQKQKQKKQQNQQRQLQNNDKNAGKNNDKNFDISFQNENEKDNNDKDNDKNNDKNIDKDVPVRITSAPSHMPSVTLSQSPTTSPTLFPTRAPVVVPWIHQTEGNALLKVSLFSYPIPADYVGKDIGGGGGNSRHLSTLPLQEQRLLVQKGGDILSNNPTLISSITSAMAYMICTTDQVNVGVLTVIKDPSDDTDRFFDFCKMIKTEQDKLAQAQAQTQLGETGADGEDANTDADTDTDADADEDVSYLSNLTLDQLSPYETFLDMLSSHHTYIITDLFDDQTGLLHIDNRSVFLPKEDEYLEWTAWSVKYPVVQFGLLNYLLPDPDWENIDYNDNGNGNGNETPQALQASDDATMDDLQTNLDRIFAKAVSNGELNELLLASQNNHEDKNDVHEDYKYATSMEGFEVDTFSSAIEELDQVFKPPDVNVPIDNNDNGEDNEIGKSSGETSNPSSSERFWQPIRISGLCMLIFLILSVSLLVKVGHERYNYDDVWDATRPGFNGRGIHGAGIIGGEDEGLDVNLVTYEGVDFMLQHGHDVRKSDQDVKISRGEISMDMGNTLSEIAGRGVPGSGDSPMVSPARSGTSKFAWGRNRNRDHINSRRQEDEEAEEEEVARYDAEVAPDQSLMPTKVTAPTTPIIIKPKRSSATMEQHQSLMHGAFPIQAPDSPTAEDLLKNVSSPSYPAHDQAPDSPPPLPTSPQSQATSPSRDNGKKSPRKMNFSLPGKKNKKKKDRGGNHLSPPSTPNGGERIGSADDYVFISVQSKLQK